MKAEKEYLWNGTLYEVGADLPDELADAIEQANAAKAEQSPSDQPPVVVDPKSEQPVKSRRKSSGSDGDEQQ